MATDFLRNLNEGREQAPGLIAAAAGVVPLAVGVGFGIRRLKSNTPVSVSEILASQANLADLGRSVGQGLKDSINLDKVTEKFMESDAFDEMMKKSQERNAVIQSLLSTMDDPAAGFDPTKLQSLKDDLIKIADESTDSESARKIMKSALSTINESGSEVLQKRFASRFREFSQVGDQLVAPKLDFKTGSAFNVIEHGNIRSMSKHLRGELFGDAPGRGSRLHMFQERYTKLMNMVGKNNASSVEIVSAASGMGQKGVYARIYSAGSGGARSYLTTVPLLANSTGEAGATMLRLGENFQTGWFAPKGVVEFEHAEDLLRRYGPGKFGERQARKHGYLKGVEDLYLSRLGQDLQHGSSGLFLRNKEGFNKYVRELLEVSSRFLSPSPILGTGHGEHQRHLANQAAMQHNTVVINGLQRASEDQKDAVMTGMIGRRGLKGRYDAGVGASRIMSDYIEGRQYGLLQRYEGSALQKFRTGTGRANRLTTPIISRIEQVAGRSARWVGSSTPMGRFGTWGAGAGAAPMEWAAEMTGLTNKAVLLDVTMGAGKGAYAATEGYGQAYAMRGLGIMETDSTIPLLDPKTHKNLSSKLQEYLHSNYQKGMGLEYFEITKDGKLLHKASNNSFDPFLGVGPSGSRSLGIDPRAKGVWLGITEAHTAHNKNQLHVTIKQRREMDRGKLFGVLHKGTAIGIEKPTFMRDLSTYGVTEGWLKSLNIPLNEVLAASGDMLKKAPDFLNVQMISGLGLVSKFDKTVDPFAYVERQIRSRLKTQGAAPSFGGGRTGWAADVVMERLAGDLKAKSVGVEDVGRVLAGLYHGSGLAQLRDKEATKAFFGGREAFKAEALEQRMKGLFGNDYGAIESVMKKGLALGASGFSAGTGHGDYGLGRGSVEPRFMEMMSTRLRDMGMSNADVSEFMVGIYKRKIGMQEGMEIIQPLERMVSSHLSMTLPGSKAPVLKVNEFFEAIAKHKSFGDYLKTQKDGVFLDFGGSNTKAAGGLEHDVAKHFGGKKQLYFAGGDAISLMQGAEIKQLGETKQVGSSYEKTVNAFAENLMKITTDGDYAAKNAATDLQRFKKDIASLYTHAFYRQAGGKIRGSIMNMMEGYATRSGVGLTAAQTGTIQGLMKGTSGMAMFMDSHGFLSMLNDYMGNDKGDLLKMFYTSSEAAHQQAMKGGAKSVTTQAGIFTATMRNPILGYGNTAISQIYRDVYEVGKGRGDSVFDTVKNLHGSAINDLEKATGRKILGWHDVAAAKETHGKAVDTFFSEMAGGLKKWVRTGGGSIYMPDDRFTVTSLGSKLKASNVDFAFSGAAIGDFDGDWANTILLDKTARRKLASTLAQGGGMEAYLQKNASIIAQGEMYKAYAKETLRAKHGADGLSEIEAELRAAQQDLLKEKGSKRVTGSVDISLNKLRRAVLNAKTEGNTAVANESLALLQMLEEHTTIKGKKLEKYVPLGDMLVAATEEAFKGEGISPIRQLFENTIFPRASMKELYSGLELSVKSASGAAVPGYVAGANGARVGLDGVLEFLSGAISNYKAIGGGQAETAAMAASRLADSSIDDAQKFLNDAFLQATSGIQSGMAVASRPRVQQALAAAEGAWGRVVGAAGKVDARMAGLVTLGLGAGAALVGMAGVDGYDSKPLMMPGDMPSAYVQKGAGSFNLLDQSSAGAASGGQGPDPYDMINTPINMGTAYVNRNNGYNVRGESSNMNGVDRVSSYLNTLTRGLGRGSIMINDMRRPITSSYVDKLTGEY